jgi:hypothetical protein
MVRFRNWRIVNPLMESCIKQEGLETDSTATVTAPLTAPLPLRPLQDKKRVTRRGDSLGMVRKLIDRAMKR